MGEQTGKKTWMDRFLNTVEAVCNKLPPPAIYFVFYL